MELKEAKKDAGVYFLEDYSTSLFEEAYIALREKEGRVFSDDDVRSLPNIGSNLLSDEWEMRQESCNRFLQYLPKNKVRILEVGCGNGWFSNKLAEKGHDVIGIDVNLLELKQAARVFKKHNLTFVYTSHVDALSPLQFDIIVLNASVQYFPSIRVLKASFNNILKNNGEVHILDSPVYENMLEAKRAASRTREYYNSMGFKELADYYHHHTTEAIGATKWLHKPSLVSKLKGHKNPFPWLVID